MINPYDVVKIEKKTPRRYDTSGQLLALDNVLSEDGRGHAGHGADKEKLGDGVHETRSASGSSS